MKTRLLPLSLALTALLVLPAGAFSDVPAGAWYDGDMLEAALSHRFTWTETPDGRAELWTAPMEEPDWAALERYGPDA